MSKRLNLNKPKRTVLNKKRSIEDVFNTVLDREIELHRKLCKEKPVKTNVWILTKDQLPLDTRKRVLVHYHTFDTFNVLMSVIALHHLLMDKPYYLRKEHNIDKWMLLE